MRVLFLSLLLFYSFISFSQKEADVWQFGYSAGLNFETNPPKPISGFNDNEEGNGCISNSYGKLLYYTNGIWVRDSNHLIIKNGTGLKGHSSATQGSIFINHKKNLKDFYIFTCSNINQNSSPFYVNLLQNDSIVIKNKLLLKYGSEKLNAVNHKNNNDIWVASYNPNTNTYYFYLVTRKGLIECPDSFRVKKFETDYSNSPGQLKFSMDGQYIASNSGNVFYTTFCKFDNENGTIRTYFNIPSFPPYSSEYSNTEKYLYILD